MTRSDLLKDFDAREDAALSVISLQSLIDGNENMEAKLLSACTDLGFFYLDCRHVYSGRIMDDVQSMYDLAKSFYDLPQEEKSEWLVDRDHDEYLVMG